MTKLPSQTKKLKWPLQFARAKSLGVQRDYNGIKNLKRTLCGLIIQYSLLLQRELSIETHVRTRWFIYCYIRLLFHCHVSGIHLLFLNTTVSLLARHTTNNIINLQQHARSFDGGLDGLSLNAERFPDVREGRRRWLHVDQLTAVAVNTPRRVLTSSVFSLSRFDQFSCKICTKITNVPSAVFAVDISYLFSSTYSQLSENTNSVSTAVLNQSARDDFQSQTGSVVGPLLNTSDGLWLLGQVYGARHLASTYCYSPR